VAGLRIQGGSFFIHFQCISCDGVVIFTAVINQSEKCQEGSAHTPQRYSRNLLAAHQSKHVSRLAAALRNVTLRLTRSVAENRSFMLSISFHPFFTTNLGAFGKKTNLDCFRA